jgi:hypothetical protein
VKGVDRRRIGVEWVKSGYEVLESTRCVVMMCRT